jgi:hypothetical protein
MVMASGLAAEGDAELSHPLPEGARLDSQHVCGPVLSFYFAACHFQRAPYLL